MLRLYGQHRNTLVTISKIIMMAAAYCARRTILGMWNTTVYYFLLELLKMVLFLEGKTGSIKKIIG